jgi:Protein of unknown function (DUF2934)
LHFKKFVWVVFPIETGSGSVALFLQDQTLMSRLYLSPEESMHKTPGRRAASEKIGALTFHLYLKDGCPEGRETDFWRRARELPAAG